MVKKNLAIGLSVVMAASMLAGCGGKEAADIFHFPFSLFRSFFLSRFIGMREGAFHSLADFIGREIGKLLVTVGFRFCFQDAQAIAMA